MSKSPETNKFSHILAKFASGNWIMCEFFARHCDKIIQDTVESPFFALQFPCWSSSTHYFTVLLKNVLFSTITPPKSLFLLFLQMCQKCLMTYKKKCITMATYAISIIKYVFKNCQTYAKNYFNKLIFSKIGTFLCFRRSKHNFHLA